MEKNCDGLHPDEQEAIKTLRNLWRSTGFGSSCTERVMRQIAILTRNDKLHGNNRDIIQASKDFRGVAKEMYTTDVETFKQFADAMKQLMGGPQRNEEQLRQQEEAQRRQSTAHPQIPGAQRSTSAAQPNNTQRVYQAVQEIARRNEQQWLEREEESLRSTPKFELLAVDFQDNDHRDLGTFGTKDKPFANNVHYVAPRVYYNYSGPSGDIRLQLDFFNPDGVRIPGPGGKRCTIEWEIPVENNQRNYWYSIGFGNGEGTIFQKTGKYTVDVRMQGQLLWRGDFYVKANSSGCSLGCIGKVFIALLLLYGLGRSMEYVYDNFSKWFNDDDRVEVLNAQWHGEFQQRPATLLIDSVADDSIFGRFMVNYKKGLENHRVNGSIETCEEGIYLHINDKDAGGGDYLNGALELFLAENSDQLQGNYVGYFKKNVIPIMLKRDSTTVVRANRSASTNGEPPFTERHHMTAEPSKSRCQTGHRISTMSSGGMHGTASPRTIEKPQSETVPKPEHPSTGYSLEWVDSVPGRPRK